MEPLIPTHSENPPSESVQGTDKAVIPAAIIFAGIIIAGAILYSGGTFTARKSSDTAKTTSSEEAAAGQAAVFRNIEDDDPALGNPDAPVVLVEFSDFQCPFCRTLWRESVTPLKEKYIKTGKVRLVYRDFPLTGIHPAAEPAAIAAECADDQGKFWEMHDKIFSEQEKLGQGTVAFGAEELARWAREIGLDTNEFSVCLAQRKHADEVAKDAADGAALGVEGTPYVFVNGKLLIRGALPWPQVEQIIEQELVKKQK